MNNIILMGNLVIEPELTLLPQSGRSVCKFRIAVRRNFKDSKGSYASDFINCQAWGKTAEIVAENCQKGNRILVQGSLYISEYENKEGKKTYSPVINVEKATIVDWANNSTAPVENDFSIQDVTQPGETPLW